MLDQSIWLVLLVEAVILTIVIIYLFSRAKKESSNRSAVGTVINRIKKDKANSHEELKSVLDDSELDSSKFVEILEEIDHTESRLYQQVIKLFLKKEVSDLKNLKKDVQLLSEAYCTLLKESSQQTSGSSVDHEELFELQGEMAIVSQEKERLSGQLATALKTLDEVSVEYSNMFGSDAGLEELNESKQRMIEIFQEAASQKDEKSEFDVLDLMEDI